MRTFQKNIKKSIRLDFYKNIKLECVYIYNTNKLSSRSSLYKLKHQLMCKNTIAYNYIIFMYIIRLFVISDFLITTKFNKYIQGIYTKYHLFYFFALNRILSFTGLCSVQNIFNAYITDISLNYNFLQKSNSSTFDVLNIYFTYYFFKKIIKRVPHRWNPKWTRKKRNIYLRNFNLPVEDDDVEYYNYITSKNKLNKNNNLKKHYLFFQKFYSLYSLIKRFKKKTYKALIGSHEKLLVNNFNTKNSDIFYNIFWYNTVVNTKIKYRTTLFIYKNTQNPLMFKKSKYFTKYSRKISRNIIKELSKSYIRIYIKNRVNFNVKRIFKLINLSSSSKLPTSVFRWIAPFKRKRINIKNTSLLSITYLNTNKSLYKFNNFFPLFGLKKHLFYKYYNTFLENSSPIFTHYYNYYFINFLETFLKSRIWFKVNTTASVPNFISKNFLQLAYASKRDQNRIGKHLFVLEMYELLWLSFFYKDLSLFAKWFKNLMEKIHYKKHKKMVKIIYNTLRLNKNLFLKLSNTKGFSMDIRGKLGATGNSKKRHLAFTVGQVTMTKKKSKLNYYHILINTSTGVLGVTFFLMN